MTLPQELLKLIEKGNIEDVVKANGKLIVAGTKDRKPVSQRVSDIADGFVAKYNPGRLPTEEYRAAYSAGTLPWQNEEAANR